MQPDSPWRSCGIPEGFTQIIETPTSRIDEVIVLIRELCTRLDDGRPAAARRGTLTAGRIGTGSLLTDGAGPEAALGPGAVSSDVGRDESLADLHTLSTPAKPPGPVSRRRPSCVPRTAPAWHTTTRVRTRKSLLAPPAGGAVGGRTEVHDRLSARGRHRCVVAGSALWGTPALLVVGR